MLKRKQQNENKENNSLKKVKQTKRNKSILGETSSNKPEDTNEIFKEKEPITNDTPQPSDESAPIIVTTNETNTNKPYEQTDEFIENVKSLKTILKSTLKSGDFSVSGQATELPTQLGLHIRNLGLISPPLTEKTANELIKVASQAPYGLNQKTLIDTKVRDSFQIQPDQIEIKNPEWNAQLDALVRRVAKKLGCSNKTVQAKLYKMLLYRKGGHFKKHRDTEKEKNMFATLVIQLPSIYQGGKLNVFHQGKKKTYDFGQSTKKAAYAVHFSAHYADLEHELLEIKSGFRLVLVYSLCFSDNQFVCLNQSDATDQLSRLLARMDRIKNPIGILLEHQYTHESLRTNGCNALKGVDMDHFNLLKAASDKLSSEDDKLCFYIVNANYVLNKFESCQNTYFKNSPLEKKIRKLSKEKQDINVEIKADLDSDESEYEDEERRSKQLGKWYDSNGKPFLVESHYEVFTMKMKIFSHLIDVNTDLAYGDVIKTYNFMSVDVEYTGNEGATQLTQYGRYLLTFWPKKQEFVISARVSIEYTADKLFCSMNNISFDDLVDKLKYLITNLTYSVMRFRYYQDRTYDKICEMLNYAKNDQLYDLFIAKLGDDTAPKSLDTIYNLWTKHGVNINKFKPVISNYIKIFNQESNFIKMLQKLNDKDAVKSYIEHVLTNMSCYSIERGEFKPIISMYKQYSLSEQQLFLNVHIDLCHLNKYCKIACALKLELAKLANDYFENILLRFLNNDQEIINLEYYMTKSYSGHNYYLLVETLLLFEQENTLCKLKELILSSLTKDSLTKLLKEFADQTKPNFKLFISSKSVHDMFVSHLKWYEERIQTHKFVNAMPQAQIYSYPVIEEFLKSDKSEMIYDCSDKQRGYLEKWECEQLVRWNSGVQNGYSCEMAIQKHPDTNRYLIRVVKTEELCKLELKQLKQNYESLKSLFVQIY